MAFHRQNRVFKIGLGLLVLVGFSVSRSSEPVPPVIAIQPYDSAAAKLAPRLASQVREEFGATLVVLPVRSLPKRAYVKARNRYRAEILLDDLASIRGHSSLLGLTTKDISTTHRDVSDWGIFGLGQMPGKACVASTFRLGRGDLAITRLRKVAIHEIGHTRGLRHCSTPRCLMSDFLGKIKTVDAATDFCTTCQRSLGR